MNQTLDLNDLLILENELKVMLSISTNTKLHYSKISKERYDFAKSLYLHEGAKIREVKKRKFKRSTNILLIETNRQYMVENKLQ